jgi:hypothetical protein
VAGGVAVRPRRQWQDATRHRAGEAANHWTSVARFVAGMGRRRSARRTVGVAGGGSTVVLQEGDTPFLFHFFIFHFSFSFIIV